MSTHEASPNRRWTSEYTHKDPKGGEVGLVGTMTGAATRYDGWASHNGAVNYGFNWSAIHAGSHVYVSASEVDNNGNRLWALPPTRCRTSS